MLTKNKKSITSITLPVFQRLSALAKLPEQGQNFFFQFDNLLQSNLKPLSDNLLGLTQKVSGLEAAQNDLLAQFHTQSQQTSALKSSDPTLLPCISVSNEMGLMMTLNLQSKMTRMRRLKISICIRSLKVIHVNFGFLSRSISIYETLQETCIQPTTIKRMGLNLYLSRLILHPSAKPFLSPSPNDGVPDLRYNQKLPEKQLSTLHSFIGAGAAALTDLLSSTELVIENLQKTATVSYPKVI